MMKIALNKPVTDEKGQAMILVLVLLVLGSLIIAPLLGFMGTGLLAGQVFENRMAEFYAADAGVEDALWKLINDPPSPYPYSYQVLDVNDLTVNVTIADIGASTYKITSIAGNTTIEAYVSVTAGGDFTISEPGDYDVSATLWDPDGIYVGGNFTLSNGADLKGDIGTVYVEGDITLSPGAEFEEDIGDLCVHAGGDIILLTSGGNKSEIEGRGNVCVCAGGNITLGAEARIKPRGEGGPVNVYVVGNLTLGAGAWIEGDVYLGGSLTLGNGAYITGNVYPYQACPCCASAGGSSQILTWEII